MAKALNRAELIGRVGTIEFKDVGSGLCQISLATDDSYRDKQGNWVDKTEWHNVVAWGKTGEIMADFLKKGDLVYVEGKIQTREYENKSGQKVRATEINCFTFVPMSGYAKRDDKTTRETDRAAQAQQPTASEDDLPF